MRWMRLKTWQIYVSTATLFNVLWFLLCRYLLVEISFQDNKIDENVTSKSIYERMKEAVQDSHGDYGAACVARSLKGRVVFYFLWASFHWPLFMHMKVSGSLKSQKQRLRSLLVYCLQYICWKLLCGKFHEMGCWCFWHCERHYEEISGQDFMWVYNVDW